MKPLHQIFPQHIFFDGSPNQRFFSDPEQNITIELTVDDRSTEATELLGDYVFQISMLSSYSPERAKKTIADFAGWLHERFVSDLKQEDAWSPQQAVFFGRAMNEFSKLAPLFGVHFFTDTLNASGLIQMIGVQQDFFIDWISVLAIEGHNSTATHLILSGYRPKEQGDYPQLKGLSLHDMNTTAICYYYQPSVLTPLLEHLGYPANTTGHIELRNMTWACDISRYCGNEHAWFRAMFVNKLFETLADRPDDQIPQIDMLSQTSAISLSDVTVALRHYHLTRRVVMQYLQAKFTEFLRSDGAQEHLQLPHWLGGSDQPLIMISASFEEKRLVFYPEHPLSQFFQPDTEDSQQQDTSSQVIAEMPA